MDRQELLSCVQSLRYFFDERDPENYSSFELVCKEFPELGEAIKSYKRKLAVLKKKEELYINKLFDEILEEYDESY
jgi:hypothetical protein